ncbi:hypothetical protein A0H81_00960 [Grifola frondosa]|uniref:DH domain-containing protein n=1 Tax=Grifola frondosa TaxID=5627 RepID=A0A1C7MT79_GRIFR|nr:hypothetical protein A0H81_00960 [Grifola frondosa]
MSSNFSLDFPSKPLPPPAKDEKLPSLPPSQSNASQFSPPPPPPKIVDDSASDVSNGHRHLAPINISASLGASDLSLGSAPLTPLTPAPGSLPSIPSSPSADARAKKSNPLTDLIETEKVYVDLLTGIIRKVAAAWSRSNLPPPELDTMFRSIEAIYKANRSLLGKLKEIGTNPSSPKALGDLLMRWIDDLETPYTTYSTKFCSGFDVWDPVQSNARVRTILAMFSSSNPPPLPVSSPAHPAEPPMWTLDELFLLPKGRLKYYKKLYARLLKSTTPGRSDHRLLSGALDKLDRLIETLETRADVKVRSLQQDALPMETEDEVVIDMRMRNSTLDPPMRQPDPPSARVSDSTRSGSLSSKRSGRRSEDTAPTSDGRTSTSTLNMPITDLERRLSTERTMDIFTMTPKQVRLQISPPSLHFTRELRISADVVITCTPRTTGVEIVQERGHLFILTDLMLVCERMTSQERAQGGPDGPEMWLLYPPLAGKHLKVAPMEGSDTAFVVTILRKETLFIHAGSPALRDRLMAAFRECIETAATLMPPSKQAPPPVPSLPSMSSYSRPPSDFQSPSAAPSQRTSGSMSPPTRALSPSGSMGMRRADGTIVPPPRGSSAAPERVLSPLSMAESMSRMVLSPEPQYGGPPRSTSAAPGGPQPFTTGQTIPNGSFGPGHVMSSQSFGPGQVMRSGSFGPGPGGPPQSFGPAQIMRNNGYNGPDAGPGPNMGLPPRPGPSYGPPQGPLPGPPGAPAGAGPPGPYGMPPPRPPSDPSYEGHLRKVTSMHSFASQYDRQPNGAPPPMPDEFAPPRPGFLPRTSPTAPVSTGQLALCLRGGSWQDPSPPGSPVEETRPTGPVTSTVSAQMKCKVFLKQQHAQWKSLGSAKLKLYVESPTNIKQLVVEAENKDKSVLISTIVLTDGVERVGKTGVAIELSDRGLRTGIIYMIQLRNEKSTQGLFDSLLAGSDRYGGNGH